MMKQNHAAGGRHRHMNLPRDWTVYRYWGEIDRVIQDACHDESIQAVQHYHGDAKSWMIRGAVNPFETFYHGGKYIVSVPDVLAAHTLRDRLNAIPSKFWLRIPIVSCDGFLQLSKKPSYISKAMFSDSALSLLQEWVRKLTDHKSPRNEWTANCSSSSLSKACGMLNEWVVTHGDKRPVTLRRQSGWSYRVTFFDPVDDKRSQSAVGDILIAVGSHISGVQDAPKRKLRSDSGIQRRICYTETFEIIDRT